MKTKWILLLFLALLVLVFLFSAAAFAEEMDEDDPFDPFDPFDPPEAPSPELEEEWPGENPPQPEPDPEPDPEPVQEPAPEPEDNTPGGNPPGKVGRRPAAARGDEGITAAGSDDGGVCITTTDAEMMEFWFNYGCRKKILNAEKNAVVDLDLTAGWDRLQLMTLDALRQRPDVRAWLLLPHGEILALPAGFAEEVPKSNTTSLATLRSLLAA